MRPADARRADWRLYYNNTWMRHDDGRVLFVQVPEGDLRGKEYNARAYEALDAARLMPVWARPGAYNIGTTAVYIGRRARRSARRSMSTEHYHIKWSTNGSARIGGKYLWAALSPEPYTPIGEAVQLLQTKEATARAISREIILSNSRNGIKVVLRGQVAGYIRDNLFIPDSEMAPLAKLARSKLGQEGVLC